MFCDQTILNLNAGNGGNGCISFRREKFIEKGGPNGGNGGKGGNIIIRANNALNSLTHLDTYKKFTAEKGEHGMGSDKHGKNGEDLILEVPQGTIIRQVIRNKKDEIIEKKEISDLSENNKMILIAKGGRGGFGNAHFVSSVRQAPKFAELGEDGEHIEVELELKLIADIGIIGIPSAGKSTLISVISNAKPKIAGYPFTTLKPNLGVVKTSGKESFIVADIPGLIEGAHKGKGLGIKFLKHIQRCKILIHIVDPSQDMMNNTCTESLIKNFRIINDELGKFSSELKGKEQIILINKSDLFQGNEEKEILKALKKEIKKMKKMEIYPNSISAATHQGIEKLKYFLQKKINDFKEKDDGENQEENTSKGSEERKKVLYQPHLKNPKYYAVEKEEDETFLVTGERITQIANMTDVNNREALLRVFDVLKKMGITKELKRQGIEDGNTILIGKNKFTYYSES